MILIANSPYIVHFIIIIYNTSPVEERLESLKEDFRMRTFTLLILSLLLLTGCESAPKQKITVGVRLSAPIPIKGARHHAAKTPLDLTVEYEIGGEKQLLEPGDDNN